MWLAQRMLWLLVFAVLGYAARMLRIAAFNSHLTSQRYEDVYYLPPAQWLPVLSLGFQDALADLIWCRSLVYFGEEIGQQGKVRFAFEYTDAIVTLSPDFREAYRWAAVLSMSRPAGTELEDAFQGATYLERALERWPSDGELHWDYGSLMRFQIAPLMAPGPEKDRVLGLAAPHLAAAASLGAGPPWLALNSVALLERLGRNEQAIRHLEEVYGTVQNERAKKRIEARLVELRSQNFVEALKAANTEFEQNRLASYPYLSQGMFFLLGPKRSSAWTEAIARRFAPPANDAPAPNKPDPQAPPN